MRHKPVEYKSLFELRWKKESPEGAKGHLYFRVYIKKGNGAVLQSNPVSEALARNVTLKKMKKVAVLLSTTVTLI